MIFAHKTVNWSLTNGLNPIEIENFCASSKSFLGICKDPEFWKWKLAQDFPDVEVSDNPKDQYYNLYIQELKKKIDAIEAKKLKDPELDKIHAIRDDIRTKTSNLRNAKYNLGNTIEENNLTGEEAAPIYEDMDAIDKDLKGLKNDMEYMMKQEMKVHEKYNVEIEKLEKIIRKLKLYEEVKKFHPEPVKIITFKNVEELSKLKLNDISGLEKMLGITVNPGMLILVRKSPDEKPSVIIYVYKKPIRKIVFAIQTLPEIPNMFKNKAEQLGISVNTLLEKYGINPKNL